ncbi:MAG: bacteriohopanetetrol glucosamine biosynthesis glycosyltransferase HpnI [Elusimicrobia bacterium]|nr:bacteriohopanetetrol glucosamine biosynthesis glycosyltransferase HpnI [Elusimicrobiota bacterium]
MDWEIIGAVLLGARIVGEGFLAPLARFTAQFSLAFTIVSIPAAYFLLRRGMAPPNPAFEPPVTILKPLKGEDRELYENLRSFCTLDYPQFQVVFALDSSEDPALPTLLRLREEFPSLDMEIVISKNRIGFNPKINNLSNTAAFIRHDVLLMSDSDIRIAPDFLKRSVAPLRDPRVGLVTCFYQSAVPKGLWAGLEALSVNCNFLPQALTAGAFGMRFAMGAAMLIRKSVLERTGGFQNLSAHLADDYVLGESVKALGLEIAFSTVAVDSIPCISSGREHLEHQARWARTIRLCQPCGYFGAVLLHGFSLLTIKMLFFGASSGDWRLAGALLAAKALNKLAVARLLGGRQSHAFLAILPLSEWIAFCAWLSGFGCGRVSWRGQIYVVEAKGRLVPAEMQQPLAVEN